MKSCDIFRWNCNQRVVVDKCVCYYTKSTEFKPRKCQKITTNLGSREASKTFLLIVGYCPKMKLLVFSLYNWVLHSHYFLVRKIRTFEVVVISFEIMEHYLDHSFIFLLLPLQIRESHDLTYFNLIWFYHSRFAATPTTCQWKFIICLSNSSESPW